MPVSYYMNSFRSRARTTKLTSMCFPIPAEDAEAFYMYICYVCLSSFPVGNDMLFGNEMEMTCFDMFLFGQE